MLRIVLALGLVGLLMTDVAARPLQHGARLRVATYRTTLRHPARPPVYRTHGIPRPHPLMRGH